MKLDARSPIHLTYCLNVHAGDAWSDNLSAIRDNALAVRDAVCPGQLFGLGLRISDAASRTLLEPGVIDKFRSFLAQNNLYVFTVNAFPYGTFHGSRVKDGVYHPDWRTAERLDYTKRVATILSRLLPAGVAGSISTVPLSYRPWGIGADDRQVMVRNLSDVAAHLESLAESTGTQIALALEPEPDCLLETTDDVVAFFHDLPLPPEEQERFRRFVGVCFDTCHLSVQFEDLAGSLRRILAAGIRVPKVQLSAALRAADSDSARHELRRFCDPVYLHQVRCRSEDGRIHRYDDLEHALDLAPAGQDEWRVHFHVPLYYEGTPPLLSTISDLTPEFFAVLAMSGIDHWEIETYTFDVLPAALRSRGVISSICREYAWVLQASGASTANQGKDEPI